MGEPGTISAAEERGGGALAGACRRLFRVPWWAPIVLVAVLAADAAYLLRNGQAEMLRDWGAWASMRFFNGVRSTHCHVGLGGEVIREKGNAAAAPRFIYRGAPVFDDDEVLAFVHVIERVGRHRGWAETDTWESVNVMLLSSSVPAAEALLALSEVTPENGQFVDARVAALFETIARSELTIGVATAEGWRVTTFGSGAGWLLHRSSPIPAGIIHNWAAALVAAAACWCLTLGRPWVSLFAAFPRLRTLRRRPPHRCWHCRYDLSGLPSGAICPECGRPGPA